MRTFRLLALICFALAAAAVGFGFVATAELIQLYGENVPPWQLAMQAAVLWLPITAILVVVGYVLVRLSNRRR